MRSSLSALGLSCALAWAGSARAQSLVLVGGFQPVTPESAGLAAMMGAVLEQRLMDLEGIELVPVDGVPSLHGTDARVYLETCPAGEQVGCTYVIAGHAEAEFAVTGSLALGLDEVLVWVSLMDVILAHEVVSLELTLPPGEDELLMEQVADLLGRVVRGEIGVAGDIREEGVYDEKRTRELVASELEELQAETGAEVQLSSMSTGLGVELPDFEPSDLDAMRQEEGLTEWERLGMREGDYLEYRNSGMDLGAWRTLSAGRLLQVLVRPRVGAGVGPVGGEYMGIYLVDPSIGADEGVVRTYAWQATRGGLGAGYGLDLGFGLSPEIEIELGLARIHGRYSATFQQEVVGSSATSEPPIELGHASTVVTGGLRLARRPTHRLRPVLGAGVVMWRGSRVTDHVDLSSLTVELPSFAAPSLVGVRALGGFELGLSPRWDLVGQLPLCLMVGDFVEVHDEGEGALAFEREPPGPMPVSASLELGLQLRLGGRDPSTQDTRHGQYEDELELD